MLFLLIVFIYTSCQNKEFADVVITETNCSMEFYSINLDSYNKWISTLSSDFFENNMFGKIKYEKSFDREDTLLKSIYYSDGSVHTVETREGWASAETNLPIYGELIEFLGSKNAIESWMKDKGFDEEIVKLYTIQTASQGAVIIPLTTWVVTKDNNYFIVTNKEYNDNNSYYRHTLYNYIEYVNEFNEKEGSLFVDGLRLNDGLVVFQCGGAYVNLDDLAEEIDIEITKDVNGEKIHFEQGVVKYTLDYHLYPYLTKFGDSQEPLPRIVGKRLFSFKIIEGELWADNNLTNSILRLFNRDIKFDFDSLIVCVE